MPVRKAKSDGRIGEKERKAWVAFSTFPQIGPVRFEHLLKYFGSAEDAWDAPERELLKLGFSQKLVSDFSRHKRTTNLNSYFLRIEELGIETVAKTDENYPKLLKNIEDSPYILYVKYRDEGHKQSLPLRGRTKDLGGKIFDILNGICIAVVGTRKMTSYGKEVTERLVTRLVDSDCIIVSGLALGIDAIAHKTAIDAGGFTIGVLGGGLDNIYPPSNKRLAEEMLKDGRGMLLSEYPLAYPYLPQNFPTRNRIIAGLSHGVLVIEGTEKSGTLLTASAAARYGREVFAVPGPITSLTSKAPHFLIKNGAKLVEKVEDILEELDIKSKIQITKSKRILPETDEEKKLFNILKNEPLDIDSLVRISGMPAQKVLSALTVMELKGMLKNIGGVYAVNI